jgi:uncharacterized protein (TIGR03435 family)
VKFDEQLGATHLEFSKMTIGELAVRLGLCLGSGLHKVVDETGMTGTYQIAYDCPLPIQQSQSDTGARKVRELPSTGGLSTLTHSLDALGLRLERRATPQQVYVIDHVEKPSEN